MAAQRTRILRAAINCIADKGVEGTSIARICKQAGLSIGAVYGHFRNRDEILAEVVRDSITPYADLPDNWPSLKALLAGFSDQHGFDLVTVVRLRMHLHAELVRAGPLHDVGHPLVMGQLAAMACHLARMQAANRVVLRFSAEQTAVNICAYIDGMVWIALASGRSLDELRPELSAGLDALVLPGPD